MKLFVYSALMATAAAAAAPAGAAVYTGSRAFGGALATYSITTDGTLGALTSANFTAWDFTLTNGGITKSFTQNNSVYAGVDNQFIATNDGLIFDYNQNGGISFGSGDALYCIVSGYVCDGQLGEQINVTRGSAAGLAVIAPNTQPVGTSNGAESDGSRIYTGTMGVGGATATYSITTNGVIGAVKSSDLKAWSFTLTDGSSTKVYNQLNGVYADYANGLSASASTLTFDFSQTGAVSFASSDAQFCLAKNVYCDGQEGEQINLTRGSSAGLYVLPAGQQMIASLAAEAAVPEPATWAMFIGGFGLIGSALRRRTPTVRLA